MNYSVHDSLVLEAASRVAQAAKILRVLEDFSHPAGLALADCSCLDVGCSAGIITRALALHVGRMVGVDVDGHALALAGRPEASAPCSPPGAALFATASGLALPFPDRSFDLALCNQVYQYVPDVPRLLAELHRVLKAGGACYFSARNLWGIASAENRLPFLASLSPRAAAMFSRGGSAWRHRAGTLWPYARLRALAARLFIVRDYTTRVLREPALAELFVPSPYRRALAGAPPALLELAKPLLPTHLWLLQKRP